MVVLGPIETGHGLGAFSCQIEPSLRFHRLRPFARLRLDHSESVAVSVYGVVFTWHVFLAWADRVIEVLYTVTIS